MTTEVLPRFPGASLWKGAPRDPKSVAAIISQHQLPNVAIRIDARLIAKLIEARYPVLAGKFAIGGRGT